MLEKDAWAQLLAFRDLANKTQTLHESQVLQLKMWPFLAVPHADVVGAHIEVNWNGPSIQFALHKQKRAKAPKNLNERLVKLDEAVKTLLGNWWTVQVTLDGTVLYNGPATGKPDSNLVTALQWRDSALAAKERKTGVGADEANAQGARSVLVGSKK